MKRLESGANSEVSSDLGQVFLEIETPDVEDFCRNWNNYVDRFDFSGLGLKGAATRPILAEGEKDQKSQVFLKVDTPDPQNFVSEWKRLIGKRGYIFSGLASLGIKGKVVGVKYFASSSRRKNSSSFGIGD
jgi:hypothetical protein